MNCPGAATPEISPCDSGTDPESLLSSALSQTGDDMKRVNALIQSRLHSDIALICTLGTYIIHSGGKRLRPLILLLSAGASNYRGDHHITLAAVIEFIHTATLLHDDVVDESATRRGQTTANKVWGNGASVLVGDFLYSRAFEMMIETGRMEIMQILSKATNAIAEGEVMQLLNAHEPDTTEATYFDTIRRKSACLFEASAKLGGVISGKNPVICDALAKYGVHLGTAFQLTDDIMDYMRSSQEMGKDAGDDLADGKTTLPLIHAMQAGNRSQAKIVRDAIRRGDRDRIDDILDIVRQTGAIGYAQEKAYEQSDLAISALTSLPDSGCRRAMEDLAHYSILRGR